MRTVIPLVLSVALLVLTAALPVGANPLICADAAKTTTGEQYQSDHHRMMVRADDCVIQKFEGMVNRVHRPPALCQQFQFDFQLMTLSAVAKAVDNGKAFAGYAERIQPVARARPTTDVALILTGTIQHYGVAFYADQAVSPHFRGCSADDAETPESKAVLKEPTAVAISFVAVGPPTSKTMAGSYDAMKTMALAPIEMVTHARPAQTA